MAVEATPLRDVIVVDEPETTPSLVRLFSVASLKTPFVPEVIGPVEDPAAFSRSLPRMPGKNAVDDFIYIKAPETKFYIPERYAQFMPMIRAAIQHHYENHQQTPLDWCTLNVMQISNGLVTGGELHLDINNYRALMHNELVNNHSYIAYDKAPTLFYCQPFTLDISNLDPEDYESGSDDMTAQFARQASPESIRQFAPFNIIHFDSTDVHQGAPLPDMGERTVCVVAFPPKIHGVSPERLGNPYLREALEALKEKPAERQPVPKRFGNG